MSEEDETQDHADWIGRLKSALEEQGRSSRDVSLAAGLNTNFVAEIFRSAPSPSIDSISAICDALDVDLAWLLTGKSAGQERVKSVVLSAFQTAKTLDIEPTPKNIADLSASLFKFV